MNNTKSVLIFMLGAAAGSAIVWGLIKKKYEDRAEEEIESYRQVKDSIKPEKEKEEQTDISEFEELAKEYRPDDDEELLEAPYIISPDEFGEHEEEGWDTITLFYYADQILADENYEIIEDVEGSVGFESLGHFGEYEDDSVFVRNEARKADYEILIDLRKYTDAIKNRPHQKG